MVPLIGLVVLIKTNENESSIILVKSKRNHISAHLNLTEAANYYSHKTITLDKGLLTWP